MAEGVDSNRMAVLRDADGRLSLWPDGHAVPVGWRMERPAGDRGEALAVVASDRAGMSPRAGRPCAWTPIATRLLDLARSGPDRPAIVAGDEVVTRAALNRMGEAVARALCRRGAGPETIVGVAVGRDPRAVAAYLGVFRAGAAYLPIDPSHPPERIARQLGDAQVGLLLADGAARTRLSVPKGAVVIDVDAALAEPDAGDPSPEPADDAGRLAYVIYTSGSTGRPKGVMVEHGSLAMHVATTAEAYEMDEASRELHSLSFAFDGGHERWMVPLYAGGCVVLRGDALWTAAETLAAIRLHGVTHAGFPTSYVALLVDWARSIGEAPRLRCLSFGGDAMARSTFAAAARHLHPDILINGYGPTEAVVSPLVWKVSSAEPPFAEPYAPIGSPVGDRRAYVLDADLRPMPEGAPGELWLGGGGLARGYLGCPELTAERFLADPFAEGGGRMYRTGDIVRRRPDGTLAFVGREDGQVKVLGFRIELGEVEARLREQPAVAEAVVVRRDSHAGERLVGYVTGRAGLTPEPARLRLKLGVDLPPAAVPWPIVVLDALPLTPNGKVDRAALPEPARAVPPAAPLRGRTQERVATLWRGILGLDDVGADHGFQDLGGTSLQALRLLSALRLAFPDGPLAIADLMDNPTVAVLADRIAAGGTPAGDDPARVVTLNAGRPGLSPVVLFPGLLVSLRDYEPLVRRLGPDRPVFGFACASLASEPRPLPPVQDIAAAYADVIAARVGPEGCTLVGWSWGGVLAFEAARHLRDRVPVHRVVTADACGLDAPFAYGPWQPLADDARRDAEAMLDAWLLGSAMRDDWSGLTARMDAPTRDGFLRFLASKPQPLPTDGPDMGSAERILHVLVDHALVMLRYETASLDVAVRSFEAAVSRAERKPVIDWSRHAASVDVTVVPDADHFDIVLSRDFHDGVLELCR